MRLRWPVTLASIGALGVLASLGTSAGAQTGPQKTTSPPTRGMWDSSRYLAYTALPVT